jgi:hypothetical protein
MIPENCKPEEDPKKRQNSPGRTTRELYTNSAHLTGDGGLWSEDEKCSTDYKQLTKK